MNSLVPCAPRKPEEMLQEIRETISTFENEDLRKLAEGMLEIAGDRLAWFPAAQQIGRAHV